MNNDFLKSLDRLIDAEKERIAAQKAESDRLIDEARKDGEHVEALKPKIMAKLSEVSTIWSGCLEAIQYKGQELGFVADICGWQEKEWHNLQVDFHLHSGGHGNPLKLTVTQRGEGQFDPNRATSFDFLQAHPSVFEGNLLNHVKDLFHQIRDGR